MKLRITLLLLAAVLLVAPFPSQAAEVSAAPSLCAAGVATPALPEVGTPASRILLKSIMIPKCGSCSFSPCIGAKVGSVCGVLGNQYEFCADVGTCSQDGLTQCHCQTGPPN
jgi:hypothetical protein